MHCNAQQIGLFLLSLHLTDDLRREGVSWYARAIHFILVPAHALPAPPLPPTYSVLLPINKQWEMGLVPVPSLAKVSTCSSTLILSSFRPLLSGLLCFIIFVTVIQKQTVESPLYWSTKNDEMWVRCLRHLSPSLTDHILSVLPKISLITGSRFKHLFFIHIP